MRRLRVHPENLLDGSPGPARGCPIRGRSDGTLIPAGVGEYPSAMRDSKTVLSTVQWALLAISLLLVGVAVWDLLAGDGTRIEHVRSLAILALVLLFATPLIPKLAELSVTIPLPGGKSIYLGVKQFETRIDEVEQRVDEMRTTTDNTLLSLASLVIAHPLDSPTYQASLDRRVAEQKTIIVGCQDYTEQRILCAILAEIVRQVADHTEVIPKYDFGGAGLNFIALSRGDVDLWTSYTWQGFEMAYSTSLAENPRRAFELEPHEAIERLNQFYGELRVPIRWVTPLGFANDWCFLMRSRDCEKLFERAEGLRLSDLRHVREPFRVRCERGFHDRPGGLATLKAAAPSGYEILLEDVQVSGHHREIYDEFGDGKPELIVGFSTDRQVQEGEELVQLDDDGCHFGRYHAAVAARSWFLDRIPGLEERLKKLLGGSIDEERMSELVRDADRTPSSVDRARHIHEVEQLAQAFVKELVSERGT